jgi:hypothetical protein
MRVNKSDKGFLNFKYLQPHISSMKFPSLFGKKFKCQACGKSFKEEEELHEHERQTHLQGKKE